MNRHRTFHNLFSLIALTIILIAGLISITKADQVISYQGFVSQSNGDPISDGLHSFGFGLYADSTGGATLWFETAEIVTSKGLFHHLLGSVSPLPASIFETNPVLFLGLIVEGENISPRSRISETARSVVTGSLISTDSNDSLAIKTFREEHKLAIYDSAGLEVIQLTGRDGDSAVIIPEASVNADETAEEAGISTDFSLSQLNLSDGVMRDLVTVEIDIPNDGYIVIFAKCYVLLSGTTGSNGAQLQIDEDEGGAALFPHYVHAGLGGYVNTDVNYFPIATHRVYYKDKGQYIFRLEGRATDALPALARSWDHMITAVYYPTSYETVGGLVFSPGLFKNSELIPGSTTPEAVERESVYKVDLRELEKK